jgi:cell division initiation protein
MITPAEIRNQTFKRSLRGYDPDEVKAFLNTVAEVWEMKLKEKQELNTRLIEVEASYRSLKEIEDMLHKTLLQAEQSSKNTMENARTKAELKVREAENKAREIVRRGIDERNRLEGEIIELKKRKEEILIQLDLFLKTQIERLKTFESNELPQSPPRQLQQENPVSVPEPEEEQESLFGAETSPSSGRPPYEESSFIDDLADEI